MKKTWDKGGKFERWVTNDLGNSVSQKIRVLLSKKLHLYVALIVEHANNYVCVGVT